MSKFLKNLPEPSPEAIARRKLNRKRHSPKKKARTAGCERCGCVHGREQPCGIRFLRALRAFQRGIDDAKNLINAGSTSLGTLESSERRKV